MGVPVSHSSTHLISILQERAAAHPDQLAYTFLHENDAHKSAQITNQALNQRVQAIGALLQQISQPGERALILYPPGLDYIAAFLGCLAAGVIAVPAYPPRPNRADARLQAIAKDAGATVALTTDTILHNISARFAVMPELATLQWHSTDQLDLTAAWRDPGLRAEQLALLQYTSGSTGNPKGVMVSHANLMHILAATERHYQLADHHAFLSWLPPYHDMGLIGGILQPLYSGAVAILMAPTAFLQHPYRWLQTITACRATFIGAPNFAYELCVQSVTAEERATLDLRTVTYASCGGEPLRAATVRRFTDTFAPCGFRSTAFFPGYGMAETTLLIASKALHVEPTIVRLASPALRQGQVVTATPDVADSQELVSCGALLSAYQVLIVDPATRTPAPPSQIGEIWLSGPSVAQGYWNQPEATVESFQAYLADRAEGPFLRTGDLGFFHQGELFVTGRCKDLIIIRGRNYYPQDIEQTVEACHPALRPSGCAAFAVEGVGTEQLVIVAEIERSQLRLLPVDAVLNAIRTAVADAHQVQVSAIQLLKPMHLPKTSSGKVQRSLCRTKFLEATLETVGAWHLPTPESLDEPGDKATTIPLHNELYFTPTQLSPAALRPAPPTAAAARERSHTHTNDLIGWLRSYAQQRLNSYLIDERRTIPPYVVLDFGNHGLLGLQAPLAYGGIALTHTDALRITEQLGAIDQTLALFVGLHNCLGLRPILNYATPAVRDELAPLLATGRELGAFALTEPGAGSHPQALATYAAPASAGGWRLTGEKSWSGSAAWAGVINVFAQQLDSNGRALGISGFVLRQGTPGLRQGPEALTMGMRGMVQNTIYLEGAAVGPAQLLGEGGAGMAVAHDAMMYGRLGLAAMSLGGMKRCAQLMVRYAERRSVATGPLLQHPVTLARLSELNAAIVAVESLNQQVTALLDKGAAVPPEIYAVCKIAGPEFFWRAADGLVQLLGGRGYIESNLAPQLLRDARVLRIFEGPTETLNHFLGGRASHRPQELDAFFRQSPGAATVAASWRDAIGAIQQRVAQAAPATVTATTATHWAYALCGEVTTWAVLLAALHWAEQQASLPTRQRALAWVQYQFEQKIAHALAHPFAPWMQLAHAALNEQIDGYRAEIGDLEQNLAGVNYELDPLLRRTAPESHRAQRHSSATGSLAVLPQPMSTHGVMDAAPGLFTYLQQWLTKTLGLPNAPLDPQQPLMSLGLDSLLAMELRNQVQRDWQVELPLSLLLDNATAATLAAFIADQRTQRVDTPAMPLSPLAEATITPDSSATAPARAKRIRGTL